MTYSIDNETKKRFAGICVLEYIINKPNHFPLLLQGNDRDVEPVLEWLLTMDYIDIQDNERYEPTEKGRNTLTRFMGRYSDFLNVFDIYCAVDLESGEFAFEHYFDFKDDLDFKNYLQDERWEDLRIAVASFKNIDPVEIVFMSFISENRFGRDEDGWQFDLLLGSVWNEILNICNTAIQWQELGFEDDEGEVSSEEVIKDLIVQGAELMIDLHNQEAELAPAFFNDYDHQNGELNGEAEEVVVVVEEHDVSYYDAYLDPFYISPIWVGLWLL